MTRIIIISIIIIIIIIIIIGSSIARKFYFFILLTHYMFQVIVIVSYEASYAFLTDPLLRLFTQLSLIIKQLLWFSKFVHSLVVYL
jgi:hypothetical protein